MIKRKKIKPAPIGIATCRQCAHAYYMQSETHNPIVALCLKGFGRHVLNQSHTCIWKRETTLQKLINPVVKPQSKEEKKLLYDYETGRKYEG